MFGGVNEDMYKGKIVRIPLTNVRGPPLLNGTWQVEERAVACGHSKEKSSSLNGYTARIDSSYPFIDLPQEAYDCLKAVTQPEHIAWFTDSIDCERRAELPDVISTERAQFHSYAVRLDAGDDDGRLWFRCLSVFQPWDMQLGHMDIIVLGKRF